MTTALRWLRNPNGSANWRVIGAFVGIALLLVVLWRDSHAADQREQATRERETAIITDAVAVNRYLIGLYQHENCRTAVEANNSTRRQFLAVSNVILDSGIPIPGIDGLLDRLRVSLDETTPQRDVAECPPIPARPVLSSPGASLPDALLTPSLTVSVVSAPETG
jgi:hypothetical protein